MYIKRDIEDKLKAVACEYACLLITGPRQVGKTTVLKNIMDNSREYVSLDDLEERKLAKKEPALFLQIHKAPLLIDEVQYAPELFPYIKIAIDNGAAPGSFWLTGSLSFKFLDCVQESLAGRVALFHMDGLSQHEIYGKGEGRPFKVSLEELKNRGSEGVEADLEEIYRRIWRGGMPALVSGKCTDRDIYYSSYVQTYIERDVSDLIDGVDKLIFSDFIRAAACRVGQILNIHDIAIDVGIADNTAKRWLQVLEKTGVIFYLRPYSNNLLKRTIKTPKLYFFDTGMVAYLTKYESAATLQSGALSGAILENYLVAEVRKSYSTTAKNCLLWYYRDKDDKEIDLILESDGQLHPLEIKRSANPSAALLKPFYLLDKGTLPRGNGAIICMRLKMLPLDAENYIVPIWLL